jgi:hypothetical protein
MKITESTIYSLTSEDVTSDMTEAMAWADSTLLHVAEERCSDCSSLILWQVWEPNWSRNVQIIDFCVYVVMEEEVVYVFRSGKQDVLN